MNTHTRRPFAAITAMIFLLVAATATAGAEDLTLDQVLAKHFEAIGVEAQKQTTRRIEGTVTIHDIGVRGKLTVISPITKVCPCVLGSMHVDVAYITF